METLYTINILNHNYDPGAILDTLCRQVIASTARIRIILWDDASGKPCSVSFPALRLKYDHSFISWQLGEVNIGRSRMRQKILESTISGWIVSIDSDMLPDPRFVHQMIATLTDPGSVYSGNHFYRNERPPAPYLLHWNYGRKREIPAKSRDPYIHFSTGIIALHTSLAIDLYFDENIQSYGHEDTMFGLLLKKRNIPIRSVPMTALHQGLNTSGEFIAKQKASVHSLQVIISSFPQYSNRLIRWVDRIKKIPGMKSLLSANWVGGFCTERLNRQPERLAFLDLLKLHEYFKIINSRK